MRRVSHIFVAMALVSLIFPDAVLPSAEAGQPESAGTLSLANAPDLMCSSDLVQRVQVTLGDPADGGPGTPGAALKSFVATVLQIRDLPGAVRVEEQGRTARLTLAVNEQVHSLAAVVKHGDSWVVTDFMTCPVAWIHEPGKQAVDTLVPALD